MAKPSTVSQLDCLLDPMMVGHLVKGELEFMRSLQVYHRVPESHRRASCVEIHRHNMDLHRGDAAHPHVRARLVGQETKRVSELTLQTRGALLRQLFHVRSGLMLSRSMTKARRQPYVRVLGFYDSTAYAHGKVRRTIVIKVPRDEGGCKSGYEVLDEALYGTEDMQHCTSMWRV